MNKPLWWWFVHPQHWPLYVQRNRLREALALRLISLLSKSEQSTDRIEPTERVVKIVSAIERGQAVHETHQSLWTVAAQNSNIVQLARVLAWVSGGNEISAGDKISKNELRALRNKTVNEIEFETFSIVNQLPVLIPIVSAFFLISGYVHTSIFFNGFRLPVSNYFGLSDYISASMDGLVATMLAAILAHLLILLQIKKQRLSALQRRLFVNNWGTFFGLSMIAVGLVLFSGIKDPDEFRAIVIYSLLVATGTTIVPFVAAYARRPNATLLLSNFIVLYIALMWFLTSMEVQNLKRPTTTVSKITLNDERATVIQKRIIAGNSLYLFLLNEHHEITVLPLENIKHVEYSVSSTSASL